MSRKPQFIVVSLCILNLSGCMLDGTSGDITHYTQPTTTPGSMLYPDSYESTIAYPLPADTSPTVPIESSDKQVVVPESYHVGTYRSPVSFKDSDHSWVREQNPQGYTIQLAQGEKPAQVANTLFKAPKGEHTAEVQYQHGSKTYYKGLYGSYPSYEAAQQAYNALPDDVKATAGITNWQNVQSQVQ